MKKQAHNPVNRKLGESDETASKPTCAVSGEFVTETFEYAGGRQVTVYVAPDQVDAQAKTNHTWLLCKAGLGNTAIEYLKFSDDDHARVVRLDGGSHSLSFRPEMSIPKVGTFSPVSILNQAAIERIESQREMHG